MEQEPVLCFFVTISQMCDKECHLLLIAITSVFKINGTARLCRLFPKGLKKGNNYILDHLKRGWILTVILHLVVLVLQPSYISLR